MRNLFCSAEPVQELAVLVEQFDQLECLEQGGSKVPRH
jgi:hypothetical protein